MILAIAIVVVFIFIFVIASNDEFNGQQTTKQPHPIDYVLPSFKTPTKKEPINYSSYIKSESWYENPARKQRLYESGLQCEMCKSNNHLEVHHLHYHSLGKEQLDDLVVLCKKCHTATHASAGKGVTYYPPIKG